MNRYGSEAEDASPESLRRREDAEVAVGRRYLGHGFLDAALRIFVRHAAHVPADDWSLLVGRLLERGRIAEAVRACQAGDIPLPRQQLLALGDRDLRHKNLEGAIHYYELAGADADRWAGLLDVLTRLPGRELLAMQVAERHVAPGGQRGTSPRLMAEDRAAED